MSKPEVDICVLCYNRDDVTARFLKHLVEHLEGVKAKIWVLDNGSTDNTWKLLRWFKANTRWWWPWARYKGLRFEALRGYANIGFARGNNYLAQKGKAPYICFINNDAFPEGKERGGKWWLHLLLFGLDGPKHGAHGPISDNVIGIQHEVWDDKFHHKSHRAQVLSGFCLAMRREVFEEMNGWDEQFMNGDEDLDLSLRLRKAGYELWVHRDVFIRHELSQSLAPWCASRGETVERHFEKTRMQLIEKHGPRCQNDMGFWEHLDQPEEKWAEMGVLPNGEYFSPPGRYADQARAIAREALSADRSRRVLQACEFHPGASSEEGPGQNGSGEKGELHSAGRIQRRRNWVYHVGVVADSSFAYAALPEGTSCPYEFCATCEAYAAG